MMDSREQQIKETKGEGAQAVSQEQAADPIAVLHQEVSEWHGKADEYLDQYRRSVAEFANYRRRQDRDREQQALQLKVDVFRGLFPIVDDFERALAHVPAELGDTDWIKGVALIERKIKTLLQQYGVAPIEVLGKPFDPNYHFALMQEASDEYPAGTVMAELQTGYAIGDRVVRPAQVKVSSGPDSQNKGS